MSLRKHASEWKRLYEEEGMTCQEIADTYQCSWQNIHQTLKTLNVKFRPRGTPRTYEV